MKIIKQNKKPLLIIIDKGGHSPMVLKYLTNLGYRNESHLSGNSSSGGCYFIRHNTLIDCCVVSGVKLENYTVLRSNEIIKKL